MPRRSVVRLSSSPTHSHTSPRVTVAGNGANSASIVVAPRSVVGTASAVTGRGRRPPAFICSSTPPCLGRPPRWAPSCRMVARSSSDMFWKRSIIRRRPSGLPPWLPPRPTSGCSGTGRLSATNMSSVARNRSAAFGMRTTSSRRAISRVTVAVMPGFSLRSGFGTSISVM